MNIVSWNVRGLGRPSKRFLVKNFLDLHNTDICCIQESKFVEVNTSTWRSFGERWLDCFSFSPTQEMPVGMIIGWRGSMFKRILVHSSPFCLIVEFTNSHDQCTWLCTTVYRPNSKSIKPEFRREIRDIKADKSLPWVIYGDFNMIFWT